MTPALKLEVDALAGTCELLRERIAELEARLEAIEARLPPPRPLSMKPNAVRQRRHYAKKRAGAEASP